MLTLERNTSLQNNFMLILQLVIILKNKYNSQLFLTLSLPSKQNTFQLQNMLIFFIDKLNGEKILAVGT